MKTNLTCICGKSFKNNAGFGRHKKHCDGISGTKLDIKNKKQKYVCPKCKYEIKTNRQKHLQSCDGSGPRRLKIRHKGWGWSKGLSYEQMYGEIKSKEVKQKSSLSHKGKPSWNVGLTKETDKRIKNLSDIARLNKYGNYGGYKQGSGRGKSGWYKGYWCDSSWELAFVIYNLDHKIKFKRNTKKFRYIFKNNTHNYIPDFKYNNGRFVEVKGYYDNKTEEKIKQFPHKITIIDKTKITPYLTYVKNKYGKDYIKLYE